MNSSTKNSERLDSVLRVALALDLAEVPLQEPRRAALRERVLAASAPCPARTNADLMSVVRADEGDWIKVLPGLSIKFLRVDVAARNQTSLWRLKPGAQLPAHPHEADEECIVLEGSVDYAGQHYARGDFLLARAGLQHEVFDSPDGALLYIRGELSSPLLALAQSKGYAG